MKNFKTMKSFVIVLFVMFVLAGAGLAQEAGDDAEILRIDTKVGQISLAIEQTIPEPFTIEVTDNGVKAENITWEGPSKKNPVQVVIVVAMNPVKKWKTDKDGLIYQIKELEKISSVKIAGINIVDDVEGFGQKLKFSKSFNINRFSELQSAIGSSLTTLKGITSDRKAVLLLTNEVESLPVNVIDRTSEILGQSSLMVYLMSINQEGLKAYNVSEKLKAKKQKIIARSNINGIDLTIRPSDFLGGLFRSFIRLASNLYTVSYDLSDDPAHSVQVFVRRKRDNRLVTRNVREFRALGKDVPAVQFTNASYKNEPLTKGDVVREIADTTLDKLLAARAAKMSPEVIDGYEAELRNRPEFRGVEILSDKKKAVKELREKLNPVLKVFGRENYTRLIVYKGDNPFLGLYRESLLIVSTKALDLLSDDEIRGAVAHELSHEIFMKELAEAELRGDRLAMHYIEFKCDLVALISMRTVVEEPYAVVNAAEKFTAFYKEHPAVDDIGEDKSPAIADRKECIRLFINGNQVLAKVR